MKEGVIIIDAAPKRALIVTLLSAMILPVLSVPSRPALTEGVLMVSSTPDVPWRNATA